MLKNLIINITYYEHFYSLFQTKNYIYLCILISSIIFIGGLIGTLITNNSLTWMISLELIFISSFLNWVFFAVFFNLLDSQIYALLTLILIAADSVLGLSLIFLLFYKKKSLILNDFKKSKL